jgi:hypothetical protein
MLMMATLRLADHILKKHEIGDRHRSKSPTN